jgi:DNA-binding response OmpR family regulator
MKPITVKETKELLITIVDDETCVRESLSSLIRSMGYKVKDYASSEEFLTWGWWEDSACLILDVHLPGMGGLELQRYLAEKQPGRAVVFISGHATENEETWSMMRGAVAFLRKPFSDESLVAAVETAIARNRIGLRTNHRSHRTFTCPLCQEPFHLEELPEHIQGEQTSIRDYTIEMIKTLNPNWVEKDGSCARCWEFYADLGRVVKFSRSSSLKESGRVGATPAKTVE